MSSVDLQAAVVVHDREAPIDPELRRRGEAHLDAVRGRSPGMFDGPVLALERIEDGVIHALHASYFDMVATCDALAGDPELRAYAEELAGPDPLSNGYGRAAAIGVTAVVVRRIGSAPGGSAPVGSAPRGPGTRGFTLGRRAAHLALDPGRWHVVPSGTVDARGLEATLADELATEHGIDEVPPIRAISLGHDRARLRPELAVITEDLGDIGPPPPSDEFAEFREIELEPEAIAAARRLDLTPAAMLALDALRVGSL
jgi:hypothetical protein